MFEACQCIFAVWRATCKLSPSQFRFYAGFFEDVAIHLLNKQHDFALYYVLYYFELGAYPFLLTSIVYSCYEMLAMCEKLRIIREYAICILQLFINKQ